MPGAWDGKSDYDRSLRERIAVLTDIARSIHADREATRRTKLRWYIQLPFGWTLHQWHTRPWCLQHPFCDLYSLLIGALRVRPWRPGDSRIRLAVTEPWEYRPAVLWGRLMCRRFGRHNATCRGRMACRTSPAGR